MKLERLYDKLEFTIDLDFADIFNYSYKNFGKSHSFSESEDIIKQSDLTFGINGMRHEVVKQMMIQIMENKVTPIVKSVINKFDGYSITNIHPSKSTSIKSTNKNEISFAYYYNVNKDIDFDNVDDGFTKALSLIIIRFANHVSKREVKDLKKTNVAQKMNIKVPPATKEYIKTSVTNIMNFHKDSLNYIEEHPEITFYSFDDIGKQFMTRLRDLQLQGDFSDEPNLNNFFRED